MDQTPRTDFPELLTVWTVLEALTVSFDRIGAYQSMRNPNGGPAALHAFIEPNLVGRIATARSIVVDLLEAADPHMRDLLDRLAADEDAIGYWQGEGTIE